MRDLLIWPQSPTFGTSGFWDSYLWIDIATDYFYRYTVQSVVYSVTHTNIYIYIYILFKKSKIYIKTLKKLLHVSITRSSSGSILSSLLNLKFKTFSELLRYVNFGALVACHVFVCESCGF